MRDPLLRAFRIFRTFDLQRGRVWLLGLVRGARHGWRTRGAPAPTDSIHDERRSGARPARGPRTSGLQTDDVRIIEQAMSDLPDGFCELLVRRDLEGLSYPELACVMGVPVGTVLSSLSRARQSFRGALDQLKQCGLPRERKEEASGCEGPGPDERYRE